jgi:DNA-binding response OmpR family regulator
VLVTPVGKVMAHRQMLKQVWGEDYDDMHILRVNISGLQGRIEPDPSIANLQLLCCIAGSIRRRRLTNP